MVRLKAIRAGQGLPLEVFVGDDLQDLRLISHNWTKLSVPGFAGSIRLRVKAGRTYHFRTDLDSRQPPALAEPGTAGPDATLSIEPAGKGLQGELNFDLNARRPL